MNLCITCKKADMSCPIWEPGTEAQVCVEYVPDNINNVIKEVEISIHKKIKIEYDPQMVSMDTAIMQTIDSNKFTVLSERTLKKRG